jgi:hypothetical protein
MMKTKKDLEVLLRNGLAAELDAFLRSHRFYRQDGSLAYLRQVADCSQELRILFDHNPTYQPAAIAHLLPQLVVTLDKVNKIVLEMLGEEPLLVGSTSITFSEQLQNAAPKEQRCVSWYVFDPDSWRASLVSIREFMRLWTMPFLNEYISAEAITRGYEKQDERLVNDRRFFVIVAAAYLSLDQAQNALEVLEEKFRRPGARRQYAKAFEYVTARLRKA